MSTDPLLFTKIRRLSQALLISGGLNIGVLALLAYWLVRERPPTPYCELKPASYEQQQLSLADHRSCGEMISRLRQLSFNQLISKLGQAQLIENGYTERDLALSCLVAFYYFDIERALPKDMSPRQQRLLMWKTTLNEEIIPLAIYPGLTDRQFASIIQFAKTERWPMTPEGLFRFLQKQKSQQNIDPSLAEAFLLTPEFLSVEVLFNRVDTPVRKQKLLETILEGDWPSLKLFVDQQRQLNDLSIARRQKFLLDYIKKGSETAAYILLALDEEFATKKLDDSQVILLLQSMPVKTIDSERFALAMLSSPRSTSVWQQASLRLYEYAGEPIPEDWDYKTSLQRFVPYKALPSAFLKSEPTESFTASDAVIPPQSINDKAVLSKSTNELKSVSNSSPIKPLTKIKATEMKAMEPLTQPLSTSLASKKKIVSSSNQSSSSPYRLYIVQEGDSLWKISHRFGVDMEVLKERNQLRSNSIKPGIVLKIP